MEADGTTGRSAEIADETMSAERVTKVIISWKSRFIDNGFVESMLP